MKKDITAEEKEVFERLFKKAFDDNDVRTIKTFLSYELVDEEFLNRKYEGGRSFLHQACGLGNFELVGLLLNETNKNLTDNQGVTPLYIACYNKKYDVTKFLVENGCNVNIATSSAKISPLHLCCNMDDAAFVNLLLKNDADICAVDADGRYPIDAAKQKLTKDLIFESKQWQKMQKEVKIAQEKLVDDLQNFGFEVKEDVSIERENEHPNEKKVINVLATNKNHSFAFRIHHESKFNYFNDEDANFLEMIEEYNANNSHSLDFAALTCGQVETFVEEIKDIFKKQEEQKTKLTQEEKGEENFLQEQPLASYRRVKEEVENDSMAKEEENQRKVESKIKNLLEKQVLELSRIAENQQKEQKNNLPFIEVKRRKGNRKNYSEAATYIKESLVDKIENKIPFSQEEITYNPEDRSDYKAEFKPENTEEKEVIELFDNKEPVEKVSKKQIKKQPTAIKKSETRIANNKKYSKEIAEIFDKIKSNNVTAEDYKKIDNLVWSEDLLLQKDEDENTILHHACKNGNSELVKFLISKNINIDEVNNKGETALHLTCFESTTAEHVKIAQILINKGAKSDLEDVKGENVYKLSKQYSSEILSLIIAKELNVTFCDNEPGINAKIQLITKSGEYSASTLLNKAIIDEDIKISNDLINAGADVNAKCDHGFTPLILACSNKPNPKIVRMLLDQGANGNDFSNDGETAMIFLVDSTLDKAAGYSNDDMLKVVEMFFEANVDFEAMDKKYGVKIIDYVKQNNKEISDFLEYNLLQNKLIKSQPELMDSFENNVSTKQEFSNLDQFLQEKLKTTKHEDVSADLVVPKELTVEWLNDAAARINKSFAVKGLERVYFHLKSISDIDVIDSYKTNLTLLQAAVIIKDLELVKALVGFGADKEKFVEGRSAAFQMACKNGNNEIAKYLAENGAILSGGDNKSLRIACLKGNLELTKIIIDDIKSKEEKLVVSCPLGKETPILNYLCSVNLSKLGKEKFFQMVDLFLESGVDLNFKDLLNDASIKILEKFNPSVVEEFKKFVCDKKANDFKKACIDGDIEKVNRLIEGGVDLNAKDEQGNTPLIFAIIAGKIDVVKILVENGADVTIKDKSGRSSLLIFAMFLKAGITGQMTDEQKNERAKVAQLLIDGGADLDCRGGKLNKTAEDYFTAVGFEGIRWNRNEYDIVSESKTPPTSLSGEGFVVTKCVETREELKK